MTRKITRALVRIKLGKQELLSLGNLDAKRDWGHARDYVEAMWLMLQQDQPQDFVIATGKQHSVRDFVAEVAKHLEIKITWKGSGENEIGVWNDKTIIKVNPKYYRPAEVETLLGDAREAKNKMNWQPKTSFEDLVKEMVDSDLKEVKE